MSERSFKYHLFDQIVPSLKKKGIFPIALRNKSAINEVIESGLGDVDLYISEDDWKIASAVIREFGFYNLFGNQVFRHPDFKNVVDVYHGYYKRAPFIRPGDLCSAREMDNGLLEPRPHILLAIIMLHPLDLTGIRGSRSYSEERKLNLRRLYGNEKIRGEFLDWCGNSIGPRFADLMRRFAENDFEYTRTFLLRMKLVLFLENPSMLKFLARRLISKLSPSVHTRGRIVSVMGVDGSGKTTLLGEMSEFLKAYMGDSGKIRYSYMGRQAGHRLPLEFLSGLVRRLRSKSSAKDQNMVKTSGLSMQGKAAQTFNRPIWKLIFPLEYAVRLVELSYLVWVRRRIVLTDRYIDDFTQDGSIGFVLRQLIKRFPKPSHVFLIVGDAKRFYERKGEYSPDELATMQEKLLTRLRSAYGKRLIILDGNQPSSVVLGQALGELHRP